jgi:uncharacterized protein HemX
MAKAILCTHVSTGGSTTPCVLLWASLACSSTYSYGWLQQQQQQQQQRTKQKADVMHPRACAATAAYLFSQLQRGSFTQR